jgi:cell division protein DivIC
MANRFNVILNFLAHYKYLIVVVIGVLIVGFIDENSFMKRIKLEMQIDNLEDEIDKYHAEYEKSSTKLNELKRNPKNIEKIARERYFMKADDEDIYVLSDDEPEQTIDQEQNKENETVK